MLRSIFILLLLLGGAVGARANETAVDLPLRAGTCTASDSRAPGAARCDWTWIEVTDPRTLDELPKGWRLLVDQTRFASIRIEVRHAGKVTTIDRRADQLQDNWSLGNYLRFEIDVPGREVDGLRIGFERIGRAALMRSVKAMTPAAHAAHKQRWSALVAFVAGVLTCSLIYNLFLLTWLRTDFQRLYVLWVATTLTYTLSWSGVIYHVLPELVGPPTPRLNYLLVGGLVAFGIAFFLALIEPGKIPRRLMIAGRACVAFVLVGAVVGAADMLVPAWFGDRLINVAFVVSTLCVAATVVAALRNGSRAVWFYLAGWVPPLVVFELRIARNFGLVPKTELVDMASFAVLAFEAVMFSLAIADRFRTLRRQHDAADAERETLRRVAATDALTGLANRAVLHDRLARLDEARQGADLVVVDLDYLKETNDAAGHDAGDALIVEAGRRLAAAAGPDATVARVGGDEFAILLEGPARARLPGLLRVVETSGTGVFEYLERALPLSLSAGHAAWVPGREAPDRLYKNADLALYRAKAEGRGRWRGFADAMREEQEARRRTIADARGGLGAGEFELHYQPVIDLRSNLLTGHEALLRWRHPSRGLLSPADFGAVFGDPVLAAAIQSFVLDAALDRAAAIHRPDGPPPRIGVNFIGAQLRGEAAADAILARLAARGLPPVSLIVEVTETVAIGRAGGPVVECLRRLRAGGVAVALDDFGTGYASLLHLRDFPADILKIDRSFVAGLPADKDSQKIVRAIIGLAHSLNKRVVAEGIETEAQRDFLRRHGCDAAQGHLLGHPALPEPADEAGVTRAA